MSWEDWGMAVEKPDKEIKKDYPDMSDKEYWEARQNLFGLFSVLMEVDKRVNPQFYKKQNLKKDD